LPAPAGSVSSAQAAAREMWDVFTRHQPNYDQCISIMVSITKMIGRKAANDEVGAFFTFLQKALKICPALGEITDLPNH
jgi:hypothetical protein